MMTIKDTNRFSLVLAACVLFGTFLSSCSGGKESNKENDMKDEIVEEMEESEDDEAQNVFYALPSPFEVSSLLKASGVEYSAEVLNSPDNVSNYMTTKRKALNLGVYGADLSISSIYEKTQETMLYLGSIKKLADDLGITSAFDNQTMERLESTKSNKDSLQKIVADAYMLANSYLKQNARSSTASLILAGGWIEGLHIATSLVDPEKPNQELIDLIADQRFSLENLVKLLELNKDEQAIQEVLTDLEGLHTLFMKIDEAEEDVVVEKGESEKVVFGGGSSVSISPELLKEVTAKINEIRTSYTK